MAKDKYEQAAMKDITKENADEEATAQVSYRIDTKMEMEQTAPGYSCRNRASRCAANDEQHHRAKCNQRHAMLAVAGFTTGPGHL